MSDSLNAGVELDTELPANELEAVEQAQEIEQLDLVSDQAALEELQARCQDLDYLIQDVTKSHGMSQNFAMEAQRLLPGFNNGLPLGYYSKSVTATQLKVSMEELSKGAWTLIAAAVAAVIGLIVKIISWVSGKPVTEKKKSSSSSGLVEPEKLTRSDVSEATEAIEQLETEVQEAAQQIEEVVEVQELTVEPEIKQEVKKEADEVVGHSEPIHGGDEVLEMFVMAERALKGHIPDHSMRSDFYRVPSQRLFDYTRDREFFVLLSNIGKALHDFAEKIEIGSQFLVKTIGESLTGKSDEITDERNFAILQEQLVTKIKNREYTIGEFVATISNERHKTTGSKSNESLGFKEVGNFLSDVFDSPILDDLLESMKSAVIVLYKAQDRMNDVGRLFAQKAEDNELSDELHEKLVKARNSILSFGREVSAFGRLFSESRTLTQELKRFNDIHYKNTKAFSHIWVEYLRRLHRAGKINDDDFAEMMNEKFCQLALSKSSKH